MKVTTRNSTRPLLTGHDDIVGAKRAWQWPRQRLRRPK